MKAADPACESWCFTMEKNLLKKEDCPVESFPWGRLEWHANGALGNSDALTLGRCVLNPGCGNTPHVHPNCVEILRLDYGRIEHSLGEEWFVMEPGDTISIPVGVPHGARNVGEGEASMTILYDTARRETVFASAKENQ